MNEVVREFVIETHENLVQLDLDLLTLEKDPTERETLARVFRTMHTIKGTAGFLGLAKLQAVAHAAENLLSRLRDGKLVLNAEIATALLSVVDAVRKMLDAVEATETDGDGDYAALVGVLERLLGPAAPAAVANGVAAEVALPATVDEVRPAPPPAATPEPARHSLIAEPAESRAPAVADTTIRVDVGLLDKLMNLVGELVLARNQMVQVSAAQENAALSGTVQRLNQLTTELQAGVMKTRMQPINTISSKFPRV